MNEVLINSVLLLFTNVFGNPFDVKVDDGLLAGAGFEEGKVVLVGHEEVLGEDGRAVGCLLTEPVPPSAS